MLKFLSCVIICATILNGGNMENISIEHKLTNFDNAQILIDGKDIQFDNQELRLQLSNMLIDCKPMPALGVSLHNETIEAINNGIWIMLIYNTKQMVDDMCFDELLIKVEKDFSGFNIIRGNNNVYDGRCYYVNLNKTMLSLYDWILSRV